MVKSLATWPSCLVLLLSASLVFVAAQGKSEKGSSKAAAEKTPAMKIRAALEQPLNEDLSAKDLNDLAKKLRDRTGVDVFLDAKGISMAFFPLTDRPITYDLKKGVKLGEALRRCLAHPVGRNRRSA